MVPQRSLVIGLLLLLSTHALFAFVVHKRSVYDRDRARGELREALKLIERQRRRLEDPRQYNPSPEQQYWWPQGESQGDLTEGDVLPPLSSLQLEDEDGRSEDGYLENAVGPEETGYDLSYGGDEPETAAEPFKSYQVPADMQELENILEPSNEEKRSVKRNSKKRESMVNDKREFDPTDSRDKKTGGNKVEELDPALVKKLIAEADRLEAEKINDYTAQEDRTTTVSPEEMQDLLSDGEEEEEEKEGKEKKSDVAEEDGPAAVMQVPSRSSQLISTKRKRSGIAPVFSARTPEEEIAALRKLVILEDEENTKLANALNMATLGQLGKTDAYIPEEIGYLQQAIGNEVKLQKALADYGFKSPDEEEEETLPVGPSDVTARKRTESQEDNVDEQTEAEKFLNYLLKHGNEAESPEVEEEQGTWYNGPAEEELEEPNNGPAEESEVEEEVPVVDLADISAPSQDEVSELEVRAQVPEVLRQYLSGMSPRQRTELKAAVEKEIQALDGPQGETCPAVDRLVTDCRLMEDEEVELDAEAKDLCNRHQLCYACGAMNGMTADDCDRGYLEEAHGKCTNDQECRAGVTALYLMFLKHHRYIPASAADDSCENPCAMDYVTGMRRR